MDEDHTVEDGGGEEGWYRHRSRHYHHRRVAVDEPAVEGCIRSGELVEQFWNQAESYCHDPGAQYEQPDPVVGEDVVILDPVYDVEVPFDSDEDNGYHGQQAEAHLPT